jgi:hypothetical protein
MQPDTAGVVAPPPLIYLAGLVVGIVVDAPLPEGSLPWVIRWILGGVLALAGIALLLSFNTAFTRKGTAVESRKPTTSEPCVAGRESYAVSPAASRASTSRT